MTVIIIAVLVCMVAGLSCKLISFGKRIAFLEGYKRQSEILRERYIKILVRNGLAGEVCSVIEQESAGKE